MTFRSVGWVYGQALEPAGWHDGALISLTELRHIHQLAMAPPTWPDVPPAISDWIADVVAVGEKLERGEELDAPLPEVLARLHNRFETVHPFLDGNGRTGRLALNLVLVRLGYPPVIIFKKQHETYLQALLRSDVGDHGPLGELIARAMLDNLNRFIVPNVTGPARFVPLASLANEEFSISALRQAAQRGKLDAHQGADGIWRSSRKAVEAYKKIRHQKRPRSS